MAGAQELTSSIAFESLPPSATTGLDFNGWPITVTSVDQPNTLINVAGILRDPADFHGSPHVTDVVQFGQAMSGLIGEYDDPEGWFADRDALPDRGIIILSDHYGEAQELVNAVDNLAGQLIADARLYDDPVFCGDYLNLVDEGYSLLRQHLPSFEGGSNTGVPVSLVRAGLVTTRLAQDLPLDSKVDDELRVITKRAHPLHGNATDLMVTVKWEDPDDLDGIEGQTLDIADCVNPASWASTAAFLLAAVNRGKRPQGVIHRSFMATEQGIVFAHKALQGSMGGIQPFTYTVGTSRTLTDHYYLTNPAVADAGHVLRHFLPEWYQQ